MAYAITNPPRLMVPSMNSNGPNIWTYQSADVDDTVNGASYFSNGVSLGMKVGDMVWVLDQTTPKGSLVYVASVTATAATTAFAAVA